MDDIFDGCSDGCLDGCFDTDGCFGIFGGGSSGRSSSYSTGYQGGRAAGTVADAVLDAVEPDESRGSRSESKHRCRGKSKPQRVTLWLTVRKERADEVADMLVRYGRDELHLPKITLWVSLWAGFGWRRIAVVAHCYFGEETELRDKTTELRREHSRWFKS